LLTHGRWFSPGTPTSSTSKTGRHDIADVLLNVALKHQKIKLLKKITCDVNKTEKFNSFQFFFSTQILY
jgi:hypothetical protein